MRHSHLIALTGFVEGREQDYNDWYTWVHLRDVMRLSLSVNAAQRFRALDAFAGMGTQAYDFPYLCIYEVTSPEAMTRDHAPVFTDDMPVSDAYDLSGASEVYFDEVAGFTRRPGAPGMADVIIERLDNGPCDPGSVSRYLGERLPQISALPGIVGASVGVPNAHQMFVQPLSGLCATYWTSDLAATVADWPVLDGAMASGGAVSLNAYAAITPRVTIFDVRNPTETERETAAQVRTRLQDRLHSGPSGAVQSEHFP